MKWYDTVELAEGTISFSCDYCDPDNFLDYLRTQGAALNPHGEPFVMRLRHKTQKMMGWEGKREVETPIGRATVLTR